MTPHWDSAVLIDTSGTNLSTTEEAFAFIEMKWRTLPQRERDVAYRKVYGAMNGLETHADARSSVVTLIAACPLLC